MAFTSASRRTIDTFAQGLWDTLNKATFSVAATKAQRFVEQHTGGKSSLQLYHGDPRDISTTYDHNGNVYYGHFPVASTVKGLLNDDELEACVQLISQLPLFAMKRRLTESEHFEEMTRLVRRYLVLRGLLRDRAPRQERPAGRPGRPRNERIAERNRIIKEIYRREKTGNDWVRLAERVNADARFKKLGLGPVTRHVARHVAGRRPQPKTAPRRKN